MKAKGLFMFKNLEKREKGQFTNAETGEVIEYGSCYVIVADELMEENKVKERRFKFDIKNSTLATELLQLEQYTKINLIFDVDLYSNNCKLTPCEFEIA